MSMDPISKQYLVGKSFQLCSATELGFSPREGYLFRYWIDNDGNTYDNNQIVTINSSSFNISAEWEKIETIPTGNVQSESIKEYNDSFDIWWMKL